MEHRRMIVVGVIILVVLWAAVTLLRVREHPQGGGQISCTEEALLCPDGSAVSREGSRCEFRACANTAQFTGELKQVEERYQLIIMSPLQDAQFVSYALPLVVDQPKTLAFLVGRRMTVYGEFVTGINYRVERFELAGDHQDGGQGQEVSKEIGVGDSVLLKGVKVTFQHVVEDSRCPVGASCIWAGRFVGQFDLKTDTDHLQHEIVLGGDEVSIDSYVVSLEDVSPHPQEGKPIDPRSYRATVHVRDIK